MKVSDYIVKKLSENGINTFFGHIGGFNADLVDSIFLSKKSRFILGYHEQASAFAANAYSILSENISVATSSGAPSSCNLIGGVANAYFDSLPCLFIVGSVHSKGVRKDKKIRQNLFEEIDMVSIVKDITKFATKINNADDIRFYLEKAIYIANEGRRGPVLLDVPYDISRSDVSVEILKGFIPEKQEPYDKIDTGYIKNNLENSKKPLILLGGGARSKQSRDMIVKLLDKVKIPAVASLCGLDSLAHNNECFIGFIGHYGNRYANFALANCDCLIVLGSRLDERQLGGHQTTFAPEVKVIRVDIDKIELGRKIPETISIYSTVENFLDALLKEDFSNCDFFNWLLIIKKWKNRYPSFNTDSKEVNANDFLQAISSYLPDNAIICADVGQNQMSVAQSLRLDYERRLLNAGGYGSMGFSLPAAVGASYANPNAMIISINGDGGFQMNIQELQTIKRDKLPVNIIIFNNCCLGMLRRLQETMFDNRTSASVDGYEPADYSSIAYAYGIEYLKVDSVDKYVCVKKILNNNKSTMIEVLLPQANQNIPEPGLSLDRQIPALTDEEYELIKKESFF